MELKQLKRRPNISQNKKLLNAHKQLEQLLTELKKEKIPNEIIIAINNDIDQVNAVSESEKELRKKVRKSQSNILKLIEKELKLVTKIITEILGWPWGWQHLGFLSGLLLDQALVIWDFLA